MTDCSKPVIAAVNGAALGAGFVLMLACDIMLACEEAYFSMPEINVGLAGGARFLMEQVGRSTTRSIYFTGRHVPAAELYRLGVIEACPPRDKLMDSRARDRARDRVQEPARVLAAKRSLNAIEEMPVRDAYRFEQSVTVELSQTEDAREAQRAFVEKRKPVFKALIMGRVIESTAASAAHFTLRRSGSGKPLSRKRGRRGGVSYAARRSHPTAARFARDPPRSRREGGRPTPPAPESISPTSNASE